MDTPLRHVNIKLAYVNLMLTLVTKKIGHHTLMDMGLSINDGLIFTIELATKFGLHNNKM
jgi:hypothetical protein